MTPIASLRRLGQYTLVLSAAARLALGAISNVLDTLLALEEKTVFSLAPLAHPK
jgi:hypothetical protein